MTVILTNRSIAQPVPTYPSLQITTASLPGATVGSPYSASMAATGGLLPYTWSAISTVPGTGSWLTLSSAGVFSGTPSTAETETVLVQVTDATGTKNSMFFSLVVSGSGSGAAPTNVQLILQGQVKAQDAQNGVPTQPNFATIGWKSVVGATSYNVYRNTVSSGGAPSYSLYTTVSATIAAAAYVSYVTAQGSNAVQSNVNCAYLDTAATNIVTFNFTTPGKTGTGPNSSGVYFPNNAYTYKVSAVVGGVESALSTDSIIIFYANGLEIMCDGFFNVNGTFNFADTTCPAVSPLGNSKNALWALDSSGTIVNPFTGDGCTSQQLGINGYNYLNMAIYAGQTGSTMNFGVEIAGDFNLTASVLHLSSYGASPIPGNVWTTYKMPLSSVQFNTQTSPNAQQPSFYKITWVTLRTGSNQPNEKYWIETWFSVT